MHEYLSPGSRDRFVEVRRGLERLGVPVVVDARLVRGLDYYNHTVFEVVFAPRDPRLRATLGRSQATVLAGGRYDGLVERLAGQQQLHQSKPQHQQQQQHSSTDVPCLGWAAGIQRLAMILAQTGVPSTMEPVTAPVLLVSIGDNISSTSTSTSSNNGTSSSVTDNSQDNELPHYASWVAQQLRSRGIPVVLSDVTSSSPGKQLKRLLRHYHPQVEYLSSLDDGGGGATEALSAEQKRAWVQALRPEPRWAFFLGDAECQQQRISFKNLQTGQQWKDVTLEVFLERYLDQ